jgi:hypothetical protein
VALFRRIILQRIAKFMPCLCTGNKFLSPQFLRENGSGKRRGG